MSIKQLKKITVYGLANEKEAIVDAFQRIGCLHLIPLSKTEQLSETVLSRTEATKIALTHLNNCPVKRRISYKPTKPVNELVDDILQNKRQMRELSDKRDKLTQRINAVRPWGNFDISLVKESPVKLWFYMLPLKDIDVIDTLQYPYEIVCTNHQFCYLVILSATEPDTQTIPLKRTHIGKHSLAELEQMREDTELMLDENQLERMRLTRWIHVIKQAVAQAEDKRAFNEACNLALDTEQMFLISGWMPTDHEQSVQKLITQHQLAALIEDPEPNESPPSLIQFSKTTGGGSDTMLFFTTPSYRTWDPGTVLFFSFSLFFGMIMNDAMYCILFGLITLLFHKKMGTSLSGCRMRTMFYAMSVIGIIWGIMADSYFGVEQEQGVWGMLHVIKMNKYGQMMKLSIIIGAIHIIIANIVVAWNHRKTLHALAYIGWAGLIAGSVILWLVFREGSPPWEYVSGLISMIIMIIGALCILLFESKRPFNNLKNILLRLLEGVGALWHITGAFGDILSYMRLFALGLAGASLANTFNEMAKEVFQSFPNMGIIFCLLILFFGHGLNLILSLMAAFVHGIRLNVIEFFKWALSDEGYPFKPFKKLEESN